MGKKLYWIILSIAIVSCGGASGTSSSSSTDSETTSGTTQYSIAYQDRDEYCANFYCSPDGQDQDALDKYNAAGYELVGNERMTDVNGDGTDDIAVHIDSDGVPDLVIEDIDADGAYDVILRAGVWGAKSSTDGYLDAEHEACLETVDGVTLSNGSVIDGVMIMDCDHDGEIEDGDTALACDNSTAGFCDKSWYPECYCYHTSAMLSEESFASGETCYSYGSGDPEICTDKYPSAKSNDESVIKLDPLLCILGYRDCDISDFIDIDSIIGD